jgi:hypothetical protein
MEFKQPITFLTTSETPNPPVVDEILMYVKSNGRLYILNSAGVETELGAVEEVGFVDLVGLPSDNIALDTILDSKADNTITVNTQPLTDNVVLTTDEVDEGFVNKYLTGNEFNRTTHTMDNIANGSVYTKTANNYTTSEKLKLAGIEANAQVNTVSSVNGQTGNVSLTSDNITQGTVNKFLTGNEFQKNTDTMDNIANGTTYRKTEKNFTTAYESKLLGIEAGAEVNTVNSVNGQTDIVILDSDDLTEGTTNLFLTGTERTSLTSLTDTSNADTLHSHAEVENQKIGGNSIKFWSGTQAEYDAIIIKDSNTIYFTTEV